jgi:mRNA interferase MazF
VVLQANELLALSTVLVAPTSTRALAASFRPEVEIAGRRTRVLVEQVGAVDQTRLGRASGRLDSSELAAVEEALRVVLGLF